MTPRRQREKDAARRREDDARSILATPQGRRWLWHLIHGTCGVLGESDGGKVEGRRSVGHDVIAELQRVDARGYLQMLTDAALEATRVLEEEAAEAQTETAE